LRLREKALIARIRGEAKRSGASLDGGTGIGDDCAVVRIPRGHETLVTTDFSLDKIHFRRAWHPAESVGHRCLTRGLSDIAAMGGEPLAAFLSLALPRRLIGAMNSLDQTLKSADRLLHNVDSNLAPQVQATLSEAQAAMKNAKELLGQDAPLENDLGSTLLQVSRAAKSISALVDYLERHPESLLRGKPPGAP